MFSGLLPINLFKGGLNLGESFFSQSYGHTCHTRFAVFLFPPVLLRKPTIYLLQIWDKIKLNEAVRSSLKLV